MQPNVPVPSISISASSATSGSSAPLWSAARAVAASWRAMSSERLRTSGLAGYLAIWLLRPIFELSIAALIYGGTRPALLRYVVVALAANAFVFNTVFYAGEVLDRQRINGTLPCLFLAPCARYSWLSGFMLAGVAETALIAAVALLFGHLVLGVSFAPDWPALALSATLFLAALWGLGMVFSAIGLLIKRSNQLSNLIFPFVMLLGGVYYPVALLPEPLRLAARALPLGYGMQALANAALSHAGIQNLAPDLAPLAGFALALPLVGILSFSQLERLARERGELDLY